MTQETMRAINVISQGLQRSLLMLLLMSSLFWWETVASQSNYSDETDLYPRRMLSNPNLVDRAIILSNYIHILASQLYMQFETLYVQDPHFYLMPIKSCHTASISTPQRKEEALRMHDKDLINLLIRLMRSWDDPLSHLRTEAVRLPKVPPSFLRNIEVIQEKMHQLLEGLKTIALQTDVEVLDKVDFSLWLEKESPQSPDEKTHLFTVCNTLHCFVIDARKTDFLLLFLQCQAAEEDTW
ncbi:PREDICTED: prolactin-like [Chinchilla lanigera]|uniref:prolactin-like n=1 Tax=Chinchilla lanigera TaxID=34839 RepID=UPI00038EB082|nr:PREDICTED: prolactin-like [Chinchilla lanigera]